MPTEKWRMDLKGGIRKAIASAEGFDPNRLEPDDYEDHAATVLAAVLPHLEAARKRGEVVAKLRQGSRLVEENERLRRELRRQIPNPRKEAE